jgi:hypothetical protein
MRARRPSLGPYRSLRRQRPRLMGSAASPSKAAVPHRRAAPPHSPPCSRPRRVPLAPPRDVLTSWERHAARVPALRAGRACWRPHTLGGGGREAAGPFWERRTARDPALRAGRACWRDLPSAAATDAAAASEPVKLLAHGPRAEPTRSTCTPGGNGGRGYVYCPPGEGVCTTAAPRNLLMDACSRTPLEPRPLTLSGEGAPRAEGRSTLHGHCASSFLRLSSSTSSSSSSSSQRRARPKTRHQHAISV